MSSSLLLRSGDLAIGTARSFEVVRGRDKLLQDLKLTILERIGTDPATPTYGSALDGGIIDGRYIHSAVGQLTTQDNLHQIQVRTRDALERYQQYQLQTLRSEVAQYGGQHTFDADELIVNIESIRVKALGTTVVVQVSLVTAAQNTIKVTIPIGQDGIG